MQSAEQGESGDLAGEGLHIGIVRARFNDAVTRRLQEACVAELAALGVAEKDLTLVEVPGALEIPAAIALALRAKRYAGFVALGCVVMGETAHFDIVSEQSARGLMDLAVQQNALIGNGILTVYTRDQAEKRAKPKGEEAAHALLSLLAHRRAWGV